MGLPGSGITQSSAFYYMVSLKLKTCHCHFSNFIHVDDDDDVGREQDELRRVQKQEEVLLKMDRDRKRAIVRAMLREVLRKDKRLTDSGIL